MEKTKKDHVKTFMNQNRMNGFLKFLNYLQKIILLSLY